MANETNHRDYFHQIERGLFYRVMSSRPFRWIVFPVVGLSNTIGLLLSIYSSVNILHDLDEPKPGFMFKVYDGRLTTEKIVATLESLNDSKNAANYTKTIAYIAAAEAIYGHKEERMADGSVKSYISGNVKHEDMCLGADLILTEALRKFGDDLGKIASKSDGLSELVKIHSGCAEFRQKYTT